jgi:hypothetical protein
MTRSGSRPACSTQSAYKLRGLYRRAGAGGRAADGVPKAVAIVAAFTPATPAADVTPAVSLAPTAKADLPLSSAAAAGCSLRSLSQPAPVSARLGEGPGEDMCAALAAAAKQCCYSRLAEPHGPPVPASTARALARFSVATACPAELDLPVLALRRALRQPSSLTGGAGSVLTSARPFGFCCSSSDQRHLAIGIVRDLGSSESTTQCFARVNAAGLPLRLCPCGSACGRTSCSSIVLTRNVGRARGRC